MKSFLRFVLIAVLAGFFTGCEKPDNPGWGNESATPRLTLMNTAITFEAEGGTISVSFLANMAWTADAESCFRERSGIETVGLRGRVGQHGCGTHGQSDIQDGRAVGGIVGVAKEGPQLYPHHDPGGIPQETCG